MRRAFESARTTLPPDVSIGIMFAFHLGEGGGLAWVAGTAREDAISLVIEWLRRQCDEGRADAVMESFAKWFGPGAPGR